MKIRWTTPDFHGTVFAVQRAALQQRVNDLLRQFRVVALLGPRQSGKTTLARQIASAIKDFPAERNYFDLEDPVHLYRLENPKHLKLDQLTLVCPGNAAYDLEGGAWRP